MLILFNNVIILQYYLIRTTVCCQTDEKSRVGYYSSNNGEVNSATVEHTVYNKTEKYVKLTVFDTFINKLY